MRFDHASYMPFRGECGCLKCTARRDAARVCSFELLFSFFGSSFLILGRGEFSVGFGLALALVLFTNFFFSYLSCLCRMSSYAIPVPRSTSH
jgi:hypothetical protein